MIGFLFVPFLVFAAAMPMLAILILIEIFIGSKTWALAFIGAVWLGCGYLWVDHWTHPDFQTPLGGLGEVFLQFLTGGVLTATGLYAAFVLRRRRVL